MNMDCWLKSGSLKRNRPTDGEEKQALDVSFKINKPTPVEGNPSQSSVKPTVKIRKYNSDYLEIGFKCTGLSTSLSLNVLFAMKASQMSVWSMQNSVAI